MPARSPDASSPVPLEPRTLAERLKWLRKRHGLTQVELSDALGCEQTVVSSWEVGRTRPSAATLTALARHYGISVGCIESGASFLQEATWTAPPVVSPGGPGTSPQGITGLPPNHPGGLLLLDASQVAPQALDAADGLSILLRALNAGRKVWIVME